MSEASGSFGPGSTTTTYNVERAHSREEGIISLPIAGEEQAVSLVRIHSPIEYETIFWSASRRGAAPIIPSWKAFITGNNTNRVFLRGQRSATIPVPTIGGHWYVVAGWYDYAIVTPESLDSNFMLGSMPWESINVNQNFIPREFFNATGIIATGKGSQQPSPFFNPYYTPKPDIEPVQPVVLQNPLPT